MSAHTPTPWVAAPSGAHMREEYFQSYAIAQSTGESVICGCFSDVKGEVPVAKANAEFIVCAVNAHDDLLAALKDMTRIVEAYSRSNNYKSHAERLAKARLAIAKATQL